MRSLVLLLLAFFSVSCSTVGFYTQALGGQMEIWRQSRPIQKVLDDPQTSARTRDRLRVAQDICEFADRELQLPAHGQYQRYADLGRRHVVWVVFAAPELDLKAKTWWYPLVGSLKYRGFFKEAQAEKTAATLRAQGDDVHVGGVSAYSSLGYLRDPLLNTFIGRPDADLAELLCHELTHQRLYLPGDTDFNEAFATVVGREGASRWLRTQGRLKDLARYEEELRIETAFIEEVLRTREELRSLYARKDRSEAERRRDKEVTIERLRRRLQNLNRRHGGTLRLDSWFNQPINNARLNTVATYHDWVPGFEALLRRCQGDLPAFYRAVAALRNDSKEQRRAKLEAWRRGE